MTDKTANTAKIESLLEPISIESTHHSIPSEEEKAELINS